MIKKEDRNVVFITDKNQALYSVVNANIICNQLGEEVKIFLLFHDLHIDLFNDLSRLIKKLGHNNIYTKNLNGNDFILGKSLPIHITNTAYLRLYLSKILPELKTVLYLDSDTIINGDINEIFDYSEYNNHYAVIDSVFSKRKNTLVSKGMMSAEKSYINSGVILFDLEKIRNENSLENFISKIKNKTLLYGDQDIVNSTLDFEYFPWFWNVGKKSFPKIQNDLLGSFNLRIYHYLMFDKQWTFNKPAFSKFSKVKLDNKKFWKKEFKKIKELF